VSVNLHTAGHRRGVVCAPHHAAVEAGRQVLADGGNAIEAMVAMATTMAAVYPHMNHLGGDGFWLIREPSGRVRALMAGGRAGTNARRELYREHEAIASRGPLAALTVPGAVAGWMLALEAAHAQGGRVPLRDLFADAIRHAAGGYVVSRSQARLTAEKLAELKDVPGFAQTFLIDGKPPDAGKLLKQPALAATLDHLGHAGLDDFYRGDIGREIASDLDRLGCPITRGDLERARATLAEPLSVALGAGTAFNTPPPTQGVASLIILALFERLGVKEAEGFDHIHGLIEATKRAFRVRDGVVSDPERMAHPADRYLDGEFLDAQARKIDRRKAAAWPEAWPSKAWPSKAWPSETSSPKNSSPKTSSSETWPMSSSAARGAGDTVWMGSADASGLVVSYIQSLYWEFGSGVVLPATGVLMQNRGASFSLESGGLNALEPGRLPLHTLNPALAVLTDGRVMAYGAMGGDGQPQTQAAIFTRHVLFNAPLDRAIDAARWLLGRTWGAANANLHMEARFEDNLIDRLVAAGHDVEVLREAYSDVMGHAGAVLLHPCGTLEAAHDPRADGGAAGV
jgi:gamma-glutamyltranspeptidase